MLLFAGLNVRKLSRHLQGSKTYLTNRFAKVAKVLKRTVTINFLIYLISNIKVLICCFLILI